MADTKITALTALTAADPANDVLPIVDVSDTTMAASGTTKKISVNNILGASGTATLASATITGDLTVATNTLKTTSGNVGIGTVTPDIFSRFYTRTIGFNSTGSSVMQINGTSYGGIDIGAAGTRTFGLTASGTDVNFGSLTNIPIVFNINGSEAMRLNSTGLGVGVASPATKLDVNGGAGGAGGQNHATFSGNAGRGLVIGTRSDSVSNDRTATLNAPFTGGSIVLQTQGTDRLLVDSSGNVGIGVTPKTWYATYGTKALQFAASGALFGLDVDSSDRRVGLLNNDYINAGGNDTYINAGHATKYQQASGVHAWYTAPSGTAGNAITFTQAMTLDASGNLLCGTTSALFNSRFRVKTSSTSASDYGVYVADSADAAIFALRNDGLIYTGTKTASPYNNTTGSAANAFIAADGTLGRSTSSLKYKTDITDSTRGLADVLKLRPVTYKSKNGDDTVFGGLIAEEVHAAGLTEFVAYAPDNAPDAIHYSNMVSLLVAAIKELTARVQTLETR